MLRGDFIGGVFVPVPEDACDGILVRRSPRELSCVISRVTFARSAVDAAVVQAREAFLSWSLLSLESRIERVMALKAAIEARREAFALQLSQEVGKPLWEARTEVSAALNKIDISVRDGLELVAPREMGSRAQRYAFRPLGVCAVLGPFNFPLHLVHGHVVPALLTGNTVVIKPSELAPGVGQLYAECFAEAGFARGVCNLVQGDASVGAELAAHADVDAVMLTGSYAAGQAIKRATLAQPHKLLALEMGGRNPAIVLGDANLEKALHDVLWGAYVSAGQRCSGTAVALVERCVFDRFASRALEVLSKLRVGDPLAPDVFMGPLISELAVERFLGALAQARADGVTVLAEAKPLLLEPEGAYVSPSLHQIHAPSGLPYETEELFGPDLALEIIDDLDHGIARANESPYGLSASVMTADGQAFEHALTRLRYGCVNWNAPTCGASSRLPFGGLRKSGNHRPAALFSSLYCTYPVATLEGPGGLDLAALSPGFTL